MAGPGRVGRPRALVALALGVGGEAPTKAAAVAVQLDVAADLGDAPARRVAALTGLKVAVDCYRRGIVDHAVVPLGQPRPLGRSDLLGQLDPLPGGGDGTSDFTRLVYGDRHLRELRRIHAATTIRSPGRVRSPTA